MASPIDAAEYLGLALIDVDAQELFEQFLASASLRWPDWTPTEGNTEVVLAEELAALIEDDGHTINSVTDNVIEALLAMYGITRYLGAAATARVKFVTYDTEGYTIPAGTVVRLNTDDGEVDLATDDDLVIAPGATEGQVDATAVESGTESNVPTAGVELEVLDAINGVDTAHLVTGVGGGSDPEDGETFINRAIPLMAAQVNTLVRPDDVTNYVAGAYPNVNRVRVIDLYNPATPDVAVSPGFVTVAVSGTAGSTISPADREVIRADVAERMHAGLIVNVVDPTITAVNVTMRVLAYRGQDAETVRANVVQVLTDYLNPDTWDWGTRVIRRNELIAQADRAEGVDVVLAVTVPALDLALTGRAALATPGVITVAVEVAP